MADFVMGVGSKLAEAFASTSAFVKKKNSKNKKWYANTAMKLEIARIRVS